MLLDDMRRSIENIAKRVRALETRDVYPGRLSATSALYFGDPDTDGSWRLTRSGNNLVEQRRESGVWVTKHTVTP